MRSALLSLFLLTAAAAAADDVLGPAEYIRLLTESKLRYNMISQPSKTPAPVLNCPRRDESTRLVAESGTRSLKAWSVKLEALTLFNEGEKLFQAGDYAGAAEKDRAALAADPQAVMGYFFFGDALLFAKDAAGALAQYEKGIALDPTIPTGHFFASTALVRLGRPDDAREQIVKALTYYPGYPAIWKIAPQSTGRWNIERVRRFKFEPPEGLVGVAGKNGTDIYGGPNGDWLGYAMCKAVWASEPQFAKKHNAQGWTLEEEHACVLNQLMSRYNQTEAALRKNQKDVTKEQVIAALPPLEGHLLDALAEHLLDGYILFEIIGQHCPLGLALLDEEPLKLIDAYIRKYVIVAR